MTKAERTPAPRRWGAVLLALFALPLSAANCDPEDEPLDEPSTCAEAPGEEVAEEAWEHVPAGTAIAWANEPPSSGPHWPVWATYRAYDEPVPRGMWVHDLEHGGVVFLYGPAATPAQVDLLRSTFDALPLDPSCGHPHALLTPDPALQIAVAVVAAGRVLQGEALTAEEITAFVTMCRGSGPEGTVCAEGVEP